MSMSTRWFLFAIVLLGFAPDADAKPVRMFVGRYGYRDPGIVFLAPVVDYGGIRSSRGDEDTEVIAHGPQYGVSIQGVSAGERDLQGQATLGYRYQNLEGLKVDERPDLASVESTIGLRYFPRAPTILFAEQFCVRATASASGGVSISTVGDLNFPIDLVAGFHFTTGRNPHGFAVELIHRPNHFDLKYRPRTEPGDPVVPEAKYDIGPWTALRVSVWIGP